jgi:hypothetical protein
MIAERTGSAATAAAMVGRRRVVVAVFGVEGDVSTRLVELAAPAVEFYFVEPRISRGRTAFR